MPVLVAVLLIILVAAGMGIGYLVKKYSPSKERMDLNEYFSVTQEDEVAVILGDELTELIVQHYLVDFQTAEAMKLGSTTDEEITYEGFGPCGIAVIVEAMTDNKNRAAADIRCIFSKSGGNLGQTGSVSYMFSKKGYILIER